MNERRWSLGSNRLAGAEIRARKVSCDGEAEASGKIADASTARAAGFTRIVRSGSEVWCGPSTTGSGRKLHVARGHFGDQWNLRRALLLTGVNR